VHAEDALLVIDMQVALLAGSPRLDSAGLVSRINDLARRVRASGGRVIFVRHTEGSGDLKAGAPGWQILPDFEIDERDERIEKSTCDCFASTNLSALLPLDRTGRLIITGFATDFCVDTTVRSAAVRGYEVWAPEDGHIASDRPHLSAQQVIQHHNYVWKNFIGARGPINGTRISDL
jgi:nicotinamidase-related amidase